MTNVTLTPPEALKHAMAAFQAGKLPQAEQLCLIILGAKPNFFDAVHLLAIIQSRTGRKKESLALFDRALVLQPNNSEALTNRGVTLRELGRLAEALNSHDQAIAARPHNAGAFNNRGNVLRDLKRLEEALTSYDQAIALRPDNIDALNNRGSTLHQLKRYEEALTTFDRLLSIKPDHAGALNNRGVILRMLKQYDAALASYERALATMPDYGEAHYNQGNTLFEMKRFEQALASYERAIAARPSHAEALNNRGNAQRELNRLEEALASYTQALAVRPDYVDAHSNCGRALMDLARPADALAVFDRALALWPKDCALHYNRGLAFHELQKFDDAIECYDRAISLNPDYADAHFAKSVALLVQGEFSHGWREYEWRRSLANEDDLDLKRTFPKPLWLGEPNLKGRTVLLHSEQGFGDTIQFCRFVQLAAQRGANVVLEVQPELKSLMSSLSGCTAVLAKGEDLPPFDYHAPLMSLPLAFKTTLDSVPNQVPYLSAPKNKVGTFRDRLGKRQGPRIGLVWAGTPQMGMPNANRTDRERRLHFDQLAPLFEQTDCQFVSLQKGGDAVEQLRRSPLRAWVIDMTEELHDFSDTAALIENLDLVIAADTSVPHLTGALGRPFWLMNRYNTCWRWLLDREDSPWYPTARIFRQDKPHAWDGVIERVQTALRDFIKNAKT